MKRDQIIYIIIFLIAWLWCVFVSSYIGLFYWVELFWGSIMIMAVMWICCMYIGLYV
jgi:hypothetical protein